MIIFQSSFHIALLQYIYDHVEKKVKFLLLLTKTSICYTVNSNWRKRQMVTLFPCDSGGVFMLRDTRPLVTATAAGSYYIVLLQLH